MAAGAAWLVAAACVLAACGDRPAFRYVTWPGCSTRSPTMEVIEPELTDTEVDGIDLTECNFTTVNLNSLKNFPKVADVDLRNIKVANITAFTCELLTNLQILTMVNNSVLGKSLPSNLFRKCYKLIYINFKDNDMSDAPANLLQGLNLKTLLLDNCNLRETPSFFTSQMFPRMDFFLADHNKISEMGPATFSNSINLTTLSLAHNRLKCLDVDLLKPLTKLERIFLGYNKLLYIPEAFFQHKPSLQLVDLRNNQIENIHLNAFLGTNLKTLYLSDNRLMYLPKNFILNLHATGMRLKRFNFHGNPWEYAYLNKLLVGIKKLKIGYDWSKYDGRHQACNILQKVNCTDNCI